MKIAIIGSGYVGLVTGACFAHLGHNVLCVDSNLEKIEILKRGDIPIYEPGLAEILETSRKAGRISFSPEISDAVRESEIIFICVDTPPKANGEADLSSIRSVAKAIAQSMRSYRLIVEKSTVPVQTGRWLEKTIKKYAKRGVPYDVASNPEFLKEGSAVQDLLKPDRIVVGVRNKRAESKLRELYASVKAPIIVTDIESAELIKHASNSFLATKISFANALAMVCDACGADVGEVTRGMGYDPRIGSEFLRAGIGFGGSCFPKDLSAFAHIAQKMGVSFDLLTDVIKINDHLPGYFVGKVKKALKNIKGKRLAVLGLAFKPDTDDMRCAPSIPIIQKLVSAGAKITAFDPQATAKARQIFKGKINYAEHFAEAVTGADALLVLTDWKEFLNIDFTGLKRMMRKPVVIDGRNMFDPDNMRRLGYTYVSMGRTIVGRRKP